MTGRAPQVLPRAEDGHDDGDGLGDDADSAVHQARGAGPRGNQPRRSPGLPPRRRRRDAATAQVSVFEKSIIEAVEFVMSIALVFLLSVIVVLMAVYDETLITTLEAALAILIASVPVALPVVMQVTLALGAGEMAKQQAIVTHLQSMQEIASMTVLCSDKTGTLTTAKINVFHDQIWCAPGFTKDEILEWAAVASNPHAEDDPIDVAVLRSFKETFPDDFDARIKRYTVSKFVGFDAVRGPRASNRRGAFDETACGAGEGTVDPRIRPSNCPFLKRTRIVRRSAFRAGHETHGRVRDDGRRRPPEAC